MIRQPRPAIFRRAASLIEAAVCVAIVGGLAAAAITASGQTMRARDAANDRVRAHQLATDLMNEVRGQKYYVGNGILGSLLVTLVGQSRSSFDEVSDYNGFTNSPPTDLGGTQLADSQWVRTVSVYYVTASNPDATSLIDTGVKRIDVVVKKNRRVLATLTALRTSAGEAHPK